MSGGALAAEPDTAVLALGGPRDYQPSGSEWIEMARPHLRSDRERAQEIIDELRHERPDSAAVQIADALLLMAGGDVAGARGAIARLVEQEPALRQAVAEDPDLRDLLPD